MADWVDVAAVDEIPPGKYRIVDIDYVSVAVYNLEGTFYAIEDVCTHDGGVLTGGELNGCIVTCPRHFAEFDIRSGEVVAPPAYESVRTFPVRVQGGIVQVKDVPPSEQTGDDVTDGVEART
jgi:3-phenylpropionate/trans-cinnamate dioxygenase ferredoxin subunit